MIRSMTEHRTRRNFEGIHILEGFKHAVDNKTREERVSFIAQEPVGGWRKPSLDLLLKFFITCAGWTEPIVTT
uniref:Uncharacterized protein n=1 Tax=Physcomitrium patens TaxID=3218 RepID=A0A2K1L2D0_PHYPA|nr:hypothetical protein PHYPA_002978 [Physcomitrium patens]